MSTRFQPIYCTRRGACFGYEAFAHARGEAGDLGLEALRSGCAGRERVVLDWACRALHLRNYAVVDPGNRTLFLNVHPEAALADASWGRDLDELIRYYGLLPRRVCVEILEAECADEGLLREAVSIYRAVGVSVALDDFGVERSNLDRVVALRPDVVKIDRSVLAEAMPGRRRAGPMLSGLVDLLHQAEARVAVEGIETDDEARLALDAGADYLQGHYFAQPQAGLPDESPARSRLARLLASGPRQARAPA